MPRLPFFRRRSPDATVRRLPLRNDAGESSVPGLYLAGELAGGPLIKVGMNGGRRIIDHLIEHDPGPPSTGAPLDVLIVGAGPAGLGAADRCGERGLRFAVIERDETAQVVRAMTPGKRIYMEPAALPYSGRLACTECTREALLDTWTSQLAELDLTPHIHEHECVENITRRRDGTFDVTTDSATYHTRRVLLAIGMSGTPRELGVPGETEHGEQISHNVTDASAHAGRDVVVVGAGDVGAEAALVLAEAGAQVTIVAPEPEMDRPARRTLDAIEQATQEGRIALELGHVVESVSATAVTIRPLAGGPPRDVAATHVFRCIGADPPRTFLRQIGVHLEGQWTRRRWMIALAAFLVCWFIYGTKRGAPLWPFNIESTFFGQDAQGYVHSFGTWYQSLQIGSGHWAFPINASFWYSLLYCLLMTVFGIQAYRRWGVAYNDRHQKARYITMISVQWTLGFLIPMVLMWWVHGMWPDNPFFGRRENFWHASGFEYPIPLFFSQFVWDVGWLYLVYSLVGGLIVIPLVSIRHGKRYCSWFCGCGGIAETLGDRWRHLAPKGRAAAKWEWMNTAILIWAVVAFGLILFKVGLGVYITGTPYTEPTAESLGTVGDGLYRGYASIVDFWFIAFIPMAAYPIFGGKIWCRYWCPMAKWIQLTSKWFGTLRITSNDDCISCGECSRYCQIGIDVMQFARRGEPFSNANTSCIHCGICVTVCPMDVLEFDNKGTGTVLVQLGVPRKK